MDGSTQPLMGKTRSLIFPSTQFLSVGNPTLSLESYAPDVVEEETEEDLEDEINREEGGGAGGVEDCNSIGSLREGGRRKEETSRSLACLSARELGGHKAGITSGFFLIQQETFVRRGHSLRIGTVSEQGQAARWDKRNTRPNYTMPVHSPLALFSLVFSGRLN